MGLMLIEYPEVRIPVLSLLPEIVDVDEGNAGLDQTPRDEEILAAHVPGDAEFGAIATAAAFTASGRYRRLAEAVALADGARFLPHIEGAAQGLRTEQVIRPVIVAAQLAHRSSRGVVVVQATQQIATLFQPCRCQIERGF